MLANNTCSDVDGEPVLVTTYGYSMRVLVVPYVAIPGVEIDVQCKDRLICEEDVSREGSILCRLPEKPPYKVQTWCIVGRPQGLYPAQVVRMEVVLRQDSPHCRMAYVHNMFHTMCV